MLVSPAFQKALFQVRVLSLEIAQLTPYIHPRAVSKRAVLSSALQYATTPPEDEAWQAAEANALKSLEAFNKTERVNFAIRLLGNALEIFLREGKLSKELATDVKKQIQACRNYERQLNSMGVRIIPTTALRQAWDISKYVNFEEA